MRVNAFSAGVAGFAAGLAAAVLVVGVSAATGAFDATTTVVRESPPPSVPLPTPAAARTVGGLDAAALYQDRSPGVVTITSALAGDDEITGSGFVVARDGLIMTNAHVVTDSGSSDVRPEDVQPAQHIYVEFADGNQVEARMVGFDLFDDVALVRVTDPTATTVPVPLGDSADVTVGEPVAAIGSPFSESGSLSVGVVSAVNRSIPSLVTRYSIAGAIQTDAAINHGNSGGPLFDAHGRVIGINAQITSTGGGGEGVGFAVPIDAAKRSMRQLLDDGKVSYGWLGVRTTSVTPALAAHFHLGVAHGALVQDVIVGSPADAAGIRAGSTPQTFENESLTPDGDVITSVDGTRIRDADALSQAMGRYAAGTVVRLRVVHGAHARTVRALLAERPFGGSP